MKKTILTAAVSLIAIGCNSTSNLINPSSVLNSGQSLALNNDDIQTFDNRLPPVVYPDGISCPSAAPLVLAQINYNHLDIEWNQNNKAHQVWMRVSRYSNANVMEFYKLVRETIGKGHSEIPIDVNDSLMIEVAFELSSLCPVLAGDTIPLSRKTVVFKGTEGARNEPVPPPVCLNKQTTFTCD